jgi:hypothetical protein
MIGAKASIVLLPLTPWLLSTRCFDMNSLFVQQILEESQCTGNPLSILFLIDFAQVDPRCCPEDFALE